MVVDTNIKSYNRENTGIKQVKFAPELQVVFDSSLLRLIFMISSVNSSTFDFAAAK